MLEGQADDMIAVLLRIAVALEKIAKCHEQQIKWQAENYEINVDEDSDEGLEETFRQ